MTAFATADDLGVRMNRTFTEPEEAWVTALLDDAAGLMRGVMRADVYPSQSSEYVAYPVAGRVTIPYPFITSIDSVQRDSEDINYRREATDLICVDCDDPVSIAVTYGLATAPADLLAINCALVSGAMMTVEAGIGLTAGGLSSVAIDDFKAAFADAGAASGMALTASNVKYLEDHYGTTAWVVEMTR